jgi:putative protease
MRYIEFLYTNNVDAIIIQDIGMFDLVHKTFPDLEIHISTQMHIHNQEGVELVKSLGASRVVLARETPIDLVKKIKNIPNIELEIFVHGALCISYSGQCLMSSLIGGRSGNRGTCAQCCRQPYELFCNDIKISKDNYLLSTRDLCTIEHIGELIEAGVDSLKIEGRMKRPEYVYLVTKLYRKAVDSYIETGKANVTEEEINDLKKIFNRNYTKGFLFNTSNDKFMNTFRPNHMGVKVGNVISVDKNRVKIRLLDNLNLNDGIRFVKNGYEDVGMNVQQMFQNNNKVTSAKKNETITLLVKDAVQVNSEVLKTTDYNQLKELDKIIQEQNRKVNVDVSLKAHFGSPLEMTISDGNHTVTNYS